MWEQNIIGVDRIYLAPWVNHFQIRRWPNIKVQVPEIRNKMRKSATIDMMNQFKGYIDLIHVDLKRARNVLIFVEYLLSRVEFFSQIAQDNDYF